MTQPIRRLLLSWVSRIALAAGVLLSAGLLAAALVRMAPGLGMDERLLDARLSGASREAIQNEAAQAGGLGLYYWQYLQNLARGDLGTSLSLGRPVRELLVERMPVSARSGMAGLGLAWVLSLLLAVVLQLSRWRPAEYLAAAAGGALLSLPAAVLALLCVYVGAPPSIAIAAILFPRIFRYVRDLGRQASGASHVMAAHAWGVSRFRILIFHVMTPVLPDLLALAGVSVSMAVGATIPVEALCDSPGVGQLVWQAALARDVPVLVNVTLLIAACTIAANLLADTARAARGQEA